MKKFLVPIVLLVLTAALAIFLTMDFSGTRSSVDADAYLAARAKIDSLELALWENRGTPDLQVSIRMQLDSAWEVLSVMRSGPANGETAADADADGVVSETVKWIVVGVAAVAICVVVLVLILRKRQEIITRRMEAIKAERFKEPKAALDDATIPLRPRARPQKRSIIADAEEYAAHKRETMAQEAAKSEAPEEEPKVAFEDEIGTLENKILTGSPESGLTTLRPTAKERITSAMQNLSDVLRAPRGLSRERTMKLRAQSRNLTGNPNLRQSPLETTRFDRESNEKLKILQMSRRGFPASAIASSLKIPQEKVEAVIKEAMG